MKKILMIAFVFMGLFVKSQNLVEEKLNFYSCTIQKDSIMKVIKSWGNNNSDLILLLSDADKITFKYTAEAIYTEKKKIKPFGFYSFQLTLLVKDGKIKFLLNDFQHFSQSQYICAGGDLTLELPNCSSDIITPSIWSEFRKNADLKSNDFLLSVQTFVNGKIGEPNIF